jgi:protein-S-isoprenylcysteine O-methyltransferase Ste14
MPLSEHEQRMLDQIERALYEEDPKFATSVDVSRIRRRRPIAAAAVFLVGLVCLVVGVIATQNVLTLGVVVSVVGFLVMVGGVGLFVFGMPGRGRVSAQPASKAARAPSRLSERMEDRLRRRFDQEG